MPAPLTVTIAGVSPAYDPVASPLDLPTGASGRVAHIRNRGTVPVDIEVVAPPADAKGRRWRNEKSTLAAGSATFVWVTSAFETATGMRLTFTATADVDYTLLDVP